MAYLHFSDAQIQAMLLADRQRLQLDTLESLAKVGPAIFEAYPTHYLLWVVQDTLTLAAPFRLHDVYALRVFLQLRFDIAPGFWRQPQIGAVLGDQGLAPMARWARLAQEPFGQAWLEAAEYDSAAEWRANLWVAPT